MGPHGRPGTRPTSSSSACAASRSSAARWTGAWASPPSPRATREAGARVAGLKVTESVCPYCAVGCGAARLHARRRARRHRGQPALADQPGHAVPEGLRAPPARPAARPPDEGQVPPPGRHGVGGARPRDGDGHDRRAVDRRPRGRLAGHRPQGHRVNRTLGFAHLGGATLDNEENYLLKKLYTGDWARSRSRTRPAYDTPPRCPVWATSFGRGGATTYQQDIANTPTAS